MIEYSVINNNKRFSKSNIVNVKGSARHWNHDTNDTIQYNTIQ